MASIIQPSPQHLASQHAATSLARKLWSQQQQRFENNASPVNAFATSLPTRSASFHNTQAIDHARENARARAASVTASFGSVPDITPTASQQMRVSHNRSASWGGKQFNWPSQSASNIGVANQANGHSAERLNTEASPAHMNMNHDTVNAGLTAAGSSNTQMHVAANANGQNVQLQGQIDNPFQSSGMQRQDNLFQNAGGPLHHEMSAGMPSSLGVLPNVGTGHGVGAMFSPGAAGANATSMETETEIDFESLTMPLPAGTSLISGKRTRDAFVCNRHAGPHVAQNIADRVFWHPPALCSRRCHVGAI